MLIDLLESSKAIGLCPMGNVISIITSILPVSTLYEQFIFHFPGGAGPTPSFPLDPRILI